MDAGVDPEDVRGSGREAPSGLWGPFGGRGGGSAQGSGPFRPALRARRRPRLGVPEGAGPPARPGTP